MNGKQTQTKPTTVPMHTDAHLIKLNFEGINRKQLTHHRNVEKKIQMLNIRLTNGISPFSRVIGICHRLETNCIRRRNL